MKDFILTHFFTIQRIFFYTTFIFLGVYLFLTGPIMLGSFQRLRVNFRLIVKLYRGDESPEAQLALINDEISAIEKTIDAALKLPHLSGEHRTEMLRMLKFCEIIHTNAPHSPSLVEDYLCDLDEMLDQLEEMVPPSLYPLNSYFLQDIPPNMTALEWHTKAIRVRYFLPYTFSFFAFSLLTKGLYDPLYLTLSFLPVVVYTLYIVDFYRYIHSPRTIRKLDKPCLALYEKCYYHTLFVLLLILVMYVALRFVLFSQ